MFTLKLLSMYFKFLVSIKFHAWVIFFSLLWMSSHQSNKSHNTPADKDWIFLIVQPCWSPLIVTTNNFYLASPHKLMQTWDCKITLAKWFFYQSLHRSTPTELCASLPHSTLGIRIQKLLMRNQGVKVTAADAGSCHSCCCPCDFHPQHPWLQGAAKGGTTGNCRDLIIGR